MASVAAHFHDTCGQAVANAWQAYLIDVRNFDSSIPGLGGCPCAPGARGNLASEDLVSVFEHAGVHTGIELDVLADTGAWIETELGITNNRRAGTALSAHKAREIQKLSIAATVEKKAATLDWTSVSSGGINWIQMNELILVERVNYQPSQL
jgi:hydroxymethylglutaryl-CoA lyase